MKTFEIDGVKVTVDVANNLVSYDGPMMIDADGSPNAYRLDDKGLDSLANAKSRNGQFVGVVVVNGVPHVQPDKVSLVSTTSYQRSGHTVCDPKRYLDSEVIPYVAVPTRVIDAVPGIVIGSRVIVTNLRTGVSCVAVAGDCSGSHIGEASIACARLLGINANARKGGTRDAIIRYEIHAGVPAVINGETFELQPHRKA